MEKQKHSNQAKEKGYVIFQVSTVLGLTKTEQLSETFRCKGKRVSKVVIFYRDCLTRFDIE
ncbi:hypothetical protein Mcup_1898 [Metallosphaera cuprina Ar-4]|uniref:Uncharacterized protein n=1 Tax=Metallosphaera cuprina (strain Ar-4) TaxID=1006006 RepID=F4G1B3_METCR|nr:hypothetical protein Mcup_1898 [Metallosphaera cuprina Ar-4]